MNPDKKIDWRTITVLNAVSTFAQLGQFGIGFVVLPLWLNQHDLNAAQLGMFAAIEWLGMFAGVAITPWLNQTFGHRKTIALGLLLGIFAFALIPFSSWSIWFAAAFLLGVGLGLRWIGLEPWLYQIAPDHALGRLVGFHETLMGIAAIIAPVLGRWYGIAGNTPFILGVLFSGLALLLLAFTRPAPNIPAVSSDTAQNTVVTNTHLLKLGVLVAVIGGLTDGAIFGLFPVFGLGRGLGTEQIEILLALLIFGGVLLQYLLGWLADHRGIIYAVFVCAASTLIIALIAALPFGFAGLAIAIFALGGTTGYLTLSLVAATKADGDLSRNIKYVSMGYTAGSIFGPLIIGIAMQNFSSEVLIWQVAILAAALCAYLFLSKHKASCMKKMSLTT